MLAAQSCVNAGAKVINIGFSCATVEPRDPERCYKPDWDYDQGVLIIGAAGNTGDVSPEYPAAYRTVMSVSAVDANNMWYDLSTQNDQVEISAPGRRVVTLKDYRLEILLSEESQLLLVFALTIVPRDHHLIQCHKFNYLKCHWKVIFD